MEIVRLIEQRGFEEEWVEEKVKGEKLWKMKRKKRRTKSWRKGVKGEESASLSLLLVDFAVVWALELLLTGFRCSLRCKRLCRWVSEVEEVAELQTCSLSCPAVMCRRNHPTPKTFLFFLLSLPSAVWKAATQEVAWSPDRFHFLTVCRCCWQWRRTRKKRMRTQRRRTRTSCSSRVEPWGPVGWWFELQGSQRHLVHLGTSSAA